MTAVFGFIVQCETCPQRAVVDTQSEEGWVCPRCSDAGIATHVHARLPGDLSPQLETRPVTIPIDDPLAHAIKTSLDRMPAPPIYAMVGDQRFILNIVTEERQDCCEHGRAHGPTTFTTEWALPLQLPVAVSLAAETFPQHRGYVPDDDGPDLRKIQG